MDWGGGGLNHDATCDFAVALDRGSAAIRESPLLREPGRVARTLRLHRRALDALDERAAEMDVDLVVLRGDDVRPRAVGPLDLPVGLPCLRGDAEDGMPPDDLDRLCGEGAVRGARGDGHYLDG